MLFAIYMYLHVHQSLISQKTVCILKCRNMRENRQLLKHIEVVIYSVVCTVWCDLSAPGVN